mmetsp:Transcript_22444/g.28666  ORF Transcript_22444/g.28666 Transcript_22444/m.28666 type:complete len:83 (+) Transcript_22444:585-833(+)
MMRSSPHRPIDPLMLQRDLVNFHIHSEQLCEGLKASSMYKVLIEINSAYRSIIHKRTNKIDRSIVGYLIAFEIYVLQRIVCS